MRVRLLVTVIALMVLGSSQAALFQSTPAYNVYLPIVVKGDTFFEQQLLDLINTRRLAYGLPILKADVTLMQVAEAHSQDMATRNYLAHISPEGLRAGDRLALAGYEWLYWGEVIAGGTVSPNETFAGWMNSPPHKAVLLGAGYEEIGAGYVEATKETKYHHYWCVVVAISKEEK